MRGRNNARAMKSATVVIFEDPKHRVVRLLNEAQDDNHSYIYEKKWYMTTTSLLQQWNTYFSDKEVLVLEFFQNLLQAGGRKI